MKKWVLFFLFPLLLFGDLSQIYSLFGIQPGTYEEITAQTHALWVQDGKERWQYDQRYEEMRDQLWPLFTEIGMVEERLPKLEQYDYACVLGALLNRVQSRTTYLIDRNSNCSSDARYVRQNTRLRNNQLNMKQQ